MQPAAHRTHMLIVIHSSTACASPSARARLEVGVPKVATLSLGARRRSAVGWLVRRRSARRSSGPTAWRCSSCFRRRGRATRAGRERAAYAHEPATRGASRRRAGERAPSPPQMCWCISPAGERELMRDRRARKPEYDTGLQYERLESFRARVWRLRAWGSRSRALGFECKVLQTSQTCR